MTESSSSNPTEHRAGIIAWLLLPLSLFPLIALLTYDWRSIPALCQPPLPHTNWIGALGDGFAYYSYTLFGLAAWLIPLLCAITGVSAVRGRRPRFALTQFWFAVFLIALSSIIQVMGMHPGLVSALAAHLNLSSAGGAVGYLIMTRALAPLLSDYGSSVMMTVIAVFALTAAVGLKSIVAFFSALWRWAVPERDYAGGYREEPNRDNPFSEPIPPELQRDDPLALAMRARENAKREREAEKERIRADKAALKAARQEEKERLRAERAAAKLAARNPPAAPANEAGGEATDVTAIDKGPYLLPSLSLLNPLKRTAADHSDVGEMTTKLISTLKLFGVDAELAYTVEGPVVTKYALYLAPGTLYTAVTKLTDNLMGALHAKSLRIEAPIPGEECIGIEVPNRAPAGITFREIIESDAWRNSQAELPLLFGKRADGKELVADLASMPHMLVAGATGQGKSVCLNAIINGLLMTRTPQQLKLIMVDPKSVEFTAYTNIPHLIVPIITENKKVAFSLRWAVNEMEKRLKMFSAARVRNIYDFNHRPQVTQTDMFGDDQAIGSGMPKTVPYIVIIIDEVADLMAACGKEVTPDIARLTAKARAAGIHLILATQRPDAKIITGTIKANIPGRVAFKTSQAIDSRTILDEAGAENLIGRGDMLFKGKDGLLVRAQGAWISDPEIANITKFIEEHSNTDFDDRFTKKLETIKEEEVDLFGDEGGEGGEGNGGAPTREQVKAEENASDFKKAVECIINTNRASTSHFQRKLGWGYNHSAKIMDMLEDAGVIGPQVGAGPRQITMDQDQLLAIFNDRDAGAAAAPVRPGIPMDEDLFASTPADQTPEA